MDAPVCLGLDYQMMTRLQNCQVTVTVRVGTKVLVIVRVRIVTKALVVIIGNRKIHINYIFVRKT